MLTSIRLAIADNNHTDTSKGVAKPRVHMSTLLKMEKFPDSYFTIQRIIVRYIGTHVTLIKLLSSN